MSKQEKLLAEKTVGLKPSGIRRFFDLVSEMKDAISLGVGEPDLKELREEIAAYMKRTQGITYDPIGEILITVGGSEAIDLMFRAMINEGDEVLIPQPSYVSYEPCTILADGKPVVIPLKNENEFRLKPEELKAAITPRSKILVLPYPNNPTGAVMEKEDLEAIADIIIENDLYVLSDEIYGELTYSGSHVSIASLPGMKERTVLVNGFSKAYAMTGWRMGYACGPKEILAQMTKIHQYAIMCAPTTSQYAAIEALRNGDDDVAQMRESYNQRRRFVMHKLEGMGLPCFEPQGAFYVFPCIKEFGMSSEEFAEELLKEEKVAIVPGTAFGDSGEGYLRISYAYSIENLREALGRLSKFVKKLREKKCTLYCMSRKYPAIPAISGVPVWSRERPFI